MNLFMKPRYTRLQQLLRSILLLLLMKAGGSGVWAQDYSGVYYLASNGYVEANTTTNYYLCPTENWYYFQSTSPFYTNAADNGMPFMTTYQCRNGVYDSSNAVWRIEKHPTQEYYYIIHAIDGKYLTYNVAMGNSSNVGRMRVHLEASPADDDAALFAITYVSSKDCYDITTKKESSRKYMNVTDGNKNSLQASGKTDGPGSMATGGIIGLWTSGSSGDNNSKWYLESAAVDAPTITNNFDGTFTITAATGATIYYTIDGSTPTTSTPTTGTTSVNISQTEDLTVIKAIAKASSDAFSSLEATYTLPQCSKPVIYVSGGKVHISSSTEGATIHYTIDDTQATSLSTTYTEPFVQGTIEVVRAIATKPGFAKSTEAQMRPPTLVHSSSEISDMSGNYILASNFTSTGSIGTADAPFTGSIDGDMVHLSLTNPFIGYAKDAVIKNVMLSSVNISSSEANVGAIASVAKGYTRIYNCGILPADATFPAGTHPSVSTTGSCAGSIVGSLEDDSRVVNCFSYADVSCGSVAGGIVGNNTFASDASVSGGKYTKLRTMVVNCMYYGNISATSSYPVYGGQKISNKGNNAINNYNFYSEGCTFSGSSIPTAYNCSWPAKLEYLTRYEFHRNLLNSNRELCGWWVGALSAPATMTTAEVQAVEKDASLMAKWVLDPAVAPYPILKPFGKYASPVNQDPDKRLNGSDRATSSNWGEPGAPDTEGQVLGSVSVSINAGNHHAGSKSSSSSRTINITAMDAEYDDFCYGKIQLPYYNDVFGNPNGGPWEDKYGGNYTDYVVTGWEITGVTDDGRERNEFVENWETGYNFADRNCTAKDNNRIFAQGGYYYVPEGVTAISIKAHWATAIYFDNADHSYDRVNMSGSNPGTHFAPAGTREETFGNGKAVSPDNISTVMGNSGGNVYDYALVLVGNHQYRTDKADICGVQNTKGFTIMSADLDFDNEPDNCLIWQLGQGTTRQSICPIRFDFLPVVEMGLAMKEDGSTQYYSLGCYRPLGHFEVTETSLIRFGQFEFSNVRSVDSPIILNGGIFEQYTKGTSGSDNANKDRITYIIIGGNVYLPSFTPGAHVNKQNGTKTTRHCAVNVLGGRIDNLYLTGNYNENIINPNKDNPHCYIDGGNFQQMAAAGKEGIDGDVYWKVNHSLIKEFYGGGTLADKRVTGNINITIDNSKVTKFCGGPKFGDMYDGKTVTTNATGTTFTYYYGGGNGGTSYVQYDNSDGEQTVSSTFNWGGTGKLNDYTPGTYRNLATGYMADYDLNIINVSTGTNSNKAIYRSYFYAAQFSATNTGSITNTLTDCEVLTNFYGGGNLGGVNGDVTSTLTGTHVHGSAFGAGYSASVPEVTIYNKDKTPPSIDVYTGIITPQSGGTSTTYTWTNETSLGGKTLSTANPAVTGVGGKNYFFTEVPLTNLGAVSGNVTLNIEGSSVVEGNEYNINTTDFSYSLKTSSVGGVFGGGDESAVSGADKQVLVNINNGTVNNVFGGGNNGDVASTVEVNVNGGSVTQSVYGGGKGQTTVVGGDVTVNIGAKSADEPPVYTGKAAIGQDVYGGSALGNTNATKGEGWTKEDLKLSAVTGKATHVNLYGGTVGRNVYGGGLGQLASGTLGQDGYVPPIASNVYGPVTVTVEGSAAGENVTAVTAANVFGCNNLYGAPQSTVEVLIKGTAAPTEGTPNPIGNVYGGGNLAAYTGSPTVAMSGGTVDKVYGGGLGASAVITGNTSVTLSGGTVNHDIFGGGDAANMTGTVTVSITGGTVTHDVYGGGALANTNTASTTTTVGETTTTTYPNTTISLTGGTIDNVYGGGLGRKASTGVEAVEAKSGNVLVELNKDVSADTKGCVVNQIFGGNNLNGYPLGTATVHVYKTQNAAKAKISEKVSDPADAGYYDVKAVYGGGNEADYIPADTRQSTEVIIEDCDNTLIKDVYGGGNAAAVPATEVWIIGAKKIDNVFGGGNGELGADHAAHVGFHREADLSTTNYSKGTGKTHVKLVGGNINVVYGGSNSNGDIRGGANIMMPTLADYNSTHDPDATTCTLKTQHIYGGGKNADMSSGTNIVLGCMPDEWIGEIYAGAQAADVAGDVSLTITSGKFGKVFGGNKDSGKLEGSITVNIEETGDCDVPIVIGELYGGGNLADYSVFGYNGDNTVKTSGETPLYNDPQVNVRAFTSIGTIYGGGYSAKLVGNPSVDINVAKGSHADNAAIHTETVGEDKYFPASDGTGTIPYIYPEHKKGEIGAIGNVFGGGNLADVIGNTSINIGTETEIAFVSTPAHLTVNAETGKYPVSGANITGSVYGGGNAADIDGNTTVTIGTVDLTGEGKNGTKIAGDVFGGGLGATTTVTGNVEVNIGADTGEAPAHNYVGYAEISGDVYGGSAKGKVNATKGGTEESPTYAASSGTTTVNFYGGTIAAEKSLYGGGYGLDAAAADVYGAGTVNMYGGTVPNVYGGNNLSGVTRDEVNVNIAGGTVSQHVYGGGNAADALGDVTVTVTGGSMTDVYGGGKGQTTVVGGDVTVNIGTKTVSEGTATYNGNGAVTGDVYGGSALGAVNATKNPSTGALSLTDGKTTAVNIYSGTVAGSAFGGGLGDIAGAGEGHADVVAQNFGNTIVTMEGGTVSTAVYGGANVNGVLLADATATIAGGTVHAAPEGSAPVADVVFGGGYGQPTRVDGNVEVNIGTNTAGTLAGNAIINGNVYGGSAEGKVNGTTAESNTHTTHVNLNGGTVNGALFGGGLGTNTIAADVYGAVTVTTKGGTAQDVFGCNNVNGAPQQTADVVIDGGTIDNVYGGGKDAAYTGTPTVTVSNGTASQNVYGGGLGATAITGGSSVTISGGTVNNDVFGGGSLANVTGNVSVSVTGGLVTGDVYGGGALAHTNTANWNSTTNTWDVADATPVKYYVPVKHLKVGQSDVYGYYTDASGSSQVTVEGTKAAEGTTYYKELELNPNIYKIIRDPDPGDATIGHTTYTTSVSATGGVIGNIYGGGLGQLGADPIAAMVYGDVTVTIDGAAFSNELVSYNYTEEEAVAYNAGLTGALRSGEPLTADQASAYNAVMQPATPKVETDMLSAEEAVAYNAKLSGAVSTSDTRNVAKTGRVFGCNNLNGTPKGKVLVRVIRTVREDGGEHADDDFEILAVYGGGNAAAYEPQPQTYDLDTEFGQHTRVVIDGCTEVSIEKVYGGGNAADVPFTDVLIDGAFQIGYVFGGGNGGDRLYYNNSWHENLGANVTGYANVLTRGGTIGQIFGGSDTRGTVGGAETTQEAGTCPLNIVNWYGAGNGEEATSDGDIIVNVSGCGAQSSIKKVFGGSYKANIKGSITLNITSGVFTSVYGGNDRMGSIGGNITVNIEETESCTTPIIIQNLYGGCYETPYPGANASTYKGAPYDKKDPASYTPFTRGKITVNVKAATRIDRVYGGSYKAGVNGDTEVNISMTKGSRAGQAFELPEGYRGNPIPNLHNVATDTYNSVIVTVGESVDGLYTYNSSESSYEPINNPEAVAEEGVTYYERKLQGTIDDAIGTIGNIYGGGYQGVVNGNAVVNVGTETELRFESIVSHLTPSRTVGEAPDPITKYYAVRGAHITGDVYGGGENADVTGNTEVYIGTKDGTTVVTEGAEGISIKGSKANYGVFGGGKLGDVGDNSSVYLGTGSVLQSVYGGCCEADVLGNATVKMFGGYVFDGIAGGGLAGSVGTFTERDYDFTGYDHTPHAGCIGKPKVCKSGTGVCTVVVTGGQVGPVEVATVGMRRPDAEGGAVPQGWIWGGSRGKIEDPAVNPDTHFTAYVDKTDVTIGGAAFILEGIVGGCEFGRVLHDTSVKIQGNCQVGVGEMSVTGTGTPADPYVAVPYSDAQWSAAADALASGDAARIDAAALAPCSHFKYESPYLPYDPYFDKYYDSEKGKYKDNVPEGFGPASTDNASDGKTWIGVVFGGGSGYFPYEKADGSGYNWLRSAGLVEGNSEVIITGGHILSNVYGANEYTDVLGKATVKMSGGTLGVPRTLAQIAEAPTLCYLFGAGKGDERKLFNQRTTVGSVEVEVSGGIIYGSVFGGGEEAHVLGDVVVNIKSDAKIGTWGTSYVDGNVFGSGRGFSGMSLTAGVVCGNVDVNISGGTMLGSIYGGGRLASVGSYLVGEDDPNYGKLIPDGEDPYGTGSTTHGHVTVNISDGTIGNDLEYKYYTSSVVTSDKTEQEIANERATELQGFKDSDHIPNTDFEYSKERECYMLTHTKGGNVFAGAMGRIYALDGETSLPRWNELGMVKSTTTTITGGTIKSNVYGGGEIGYVKGYHEKDGSHLSTEINISGSSTLIGSELLSGSEKMLTFGSVYGGGYGSTIEVLDDAAADIKNPKYIAAMVSDSTEVTLQEASVKASVYGGGEVGNIQGSTHVVINSGTIGIDKIGDRQFGGATMGNVYGGGSGNRTITRCGQVFTNTLVEIYGGRIYHNIYGGGAYGTVGNFTYEMGHEGEFGTIKVQGIEGLAAGYENSGNIKVSITGGTIGVDGHENGMVFGSSRGDVSLAGERDKRDNFLAWANNTHVSIGTAGQGFDAPQPQIKGSVYGGGENGHNFGNAKVYVHSGTIGTNAAASYANGNVYGSGCGTDEYDSDGDGIDDAHNALAGFVRRSTIINIDGGHVLSSVYGGGSMASVGTTYSIKKMFGNEAKALIGMSGGKATLNISGGTIDGSVYGAPKGDLTDTELKARANATEVNILPGANVLGSVYGGGEAGIVEGSVDVNMTGGTVGSCVYGGGALADTNTGNVTDYDGASPALSSTATYKTTVRLTGGTIASDAFGGALGRLEIKTGDVVTTTAIEPKVYGDILVELNNNNDGGTADGSKKGCIVKRVFGCNNNHGTPKGKVNVHVYATQNAAATQIANSGSVSDAKVKGRYDVTAVYGGGNLAEYNPESSGDRTEVVIDGCDLTSIRTVYGGSNAAPAPSTYVRINSTFEIDSLFGGGNGKDPYKLADGKWYENPGANVGYHHFRHYLTDDTQGTGAYATPYLALINTDADTKEKRQANYKYGQGEALTEVVGGLIHHAWGGSNQRGNISMTVESRYQDAGVCPMNVEESTGGSNNADLDAKIIAQLDCVENMDQFFGGSTNADVNNDIELTITNGTYRQVFGGNNTSGAINGSITVNIVERGCKPIIIGELYAAGYLAPYSIYGYQKNADGTYELQDGKPIPLKSGAPGALTGDDIHAHPRINIISATHIGTVYGGGYQAMVVGDPRINVNMERGRVLASYADKKPADFTPEVHTDSDGNKYTVESYTTGSDAVLAIGNIGNIFGGGDEADIIGNTYIEIGTGEWINGDGERETLSQTDGKTYTYDTSSKKWVAEDGTEADEKPAARNAAFITGSVYGGGKMGHVGDFSPIGDKPTECAEGTGTCSILISNGEIGPDDMKMTATGGPDDNGHVFGGGQGTVDLLYNDKTKTPAEKQAAIALLSDEEKTAKEAILDRLAYNNKTEVTINGTAFVKGSVYGGSENGHVLGDTHVTIDGDCQIGNGWNPTLNEGAGGGVNQPYTTEEWAYDVTTDQTKFLWECASWPYGIDSDNDGTKDTFQPHDMYAEAGGGYVAEGAVVASDGHTFYGNVFGGGSGYYPAAPGWWVKKAGWVEGNTLVEIKGGHILTNVYGGNEMTNVGNGLAAGKGKSTIRMSGGTLGVPRSLEQIAAHPVTCYLFGAGKGDQNVHFNKDTNVKEVEMELTGGKIYGSVFGGGEDGHVLGDVRMTIGNDDGTGPTIGTWGTSYVDGNVFGGGRGYSGEAFTAGNVGGSVNLQIKGGLMLGSIYGGGRMASVGYGLYDTSDDRYGKMRDNDKDDAGASTDYYLSTGLNKKGRGQVNIDISGGTIGNTFEYGYYAVDVPTEGRTWTAIETERSGWLAGKKTEDHIPNTEFLLHDSIDNNDGSKKYVYRLYHAKGGNVYAGGMGRFTNLSGSDLPRWFNLGAVKSTKLTIRDNARIKSSVYGGCELGQVAGSYRDATLFEKKITIEDGEEKVEAEKPIPTRTSETLTDILITGGEIGSDIKDDGSVTRLVFGAVYGGGYGNTREKLVYEAPDPETGVTTKYESNPKFTSGIVEGNTRVEIQDGTVHSSVYGGGKVGNIHGNTTVIVSGGTIGRDMDTDNDIRFGGQFMGNVYGGGAGNRKIVRCGQIFGNTNVNISQAEGKTTHIYHNVYGGGAFGSVGKFVYDTRYDEQEKTTKVFGVESLQSDGTATVTITGGTIGYDGKNNGMVFGSSRGDVSDPHYRDNFMAFVGNTIVHIGTAGQGFDEPQPQIKGSVYGSGENGHVMEKATVNIHSGTIGIPSGTPVDGKEGVFYPFRGNVYGAGCGTDTYIENGLEMYSPMAGAVLGNTELNIDGGHIVRNVYGGGSMGSVGFITDSVKHASIADGFGLSWPYEFKYKENTGTATINITGGRIGVDDSGIVGVDNGNVYGGARGTAGERYYAAHLANVRQTRVTIDYPGETPTTDDGSTTPLIVGSVFGGGEDGHIYENTLVFLRNGRIGHTLFGGGRGEGTYLGRLQKIPTGSGETGLQQIRDISTGKVYGNTYVEMSGGHVVHNVLGGGYMASVGKGNYSSGADDYFPTGYGETIAGNLWTTAYAPDPEKPASDPVNVKDNAWHFLNSGKTYVNIKGGIVGSLDIWDGLPSGNVFGGSRGLAAPNIALPTIEQCPVFYNGYVNETHIHIYDSIGVAAPRIYGSVYGGGQDGHVRRDAHVVIDGGEIGLPFTSENQTELGTSDPDNAQWLHRGNVYGAGSGIGQYAFDFNYNGDTEDDGETGYSSSAGSVTRFTQVDINGGTVHRNVYGGGSMGSVGAPNLGQEDEPYKKGDTAEGHGPGKQSFCTVNIAGTIGTPDNYNPLYGGEVYGASRGLSTLDPAQFATTVWTKVNIFKTATVKGNVFGGGDAGAVRKDAEVVVGEE